jgi:murein DD-endopeptidase MepM/ murein hydrolase activator NlpD
MIFRNEQVDWPLDVNIIRRQSENNTFGMVRRRGDGTPKPHQGWDFFAIPGVPCYSIANGKVVYAGQAGDLGNLIVISIGNTGFYAAYAHLHAIRVKKGQAVALGQVIGTTGTSGNAAGMTGEDQHLHFEIRDMPLPGLGLQHRYSPFIVFDYCPLHVEAKREKRNV